MNLSQLTGLGLTHAAGPTDITVSGITADSRAVKPGDIFAALPGATTDGAKFAAAAIAAGATAILTPPAATLDLPGNVAHLTAIEPRRALALIAARLHPAQPKTIVAITGTNGKTSVADFTRQIFATLGRNAASLGTIGIVRSDGTTYGSLTTPDPVTLHKTLHSLATDGVTHLAMEASSHGLDQFRLDGVNLSAGAFLNLGRDHLDYHPTVDAYFDAKLRLFRDLLASGQPAIFVSAAPYADAAIAAARTRGLNVMTVGTSGDTLRLTNVTRDGFRQRLTVHHAGREHTISLGLIGTYQATNALAAACLAIATGENPGDSISAIEHLKGVSGRLEVIGEHNGGIVVVDYAHKPEALSAALAALRPFASGRLICAIGCGGNRDRGKRPIMGQIAATEADHVIITDDNPRNEQPDVIRAEILAGIDAAHRSRAHEIGDRASAIAEGVAMLGPGDVLLVAGKGHETGQIVGDTVIPFSDQDTIRACLG